MRIDTSLTGPASGTPAGVFAWAKGREARRQAFLREYLETLYREAVNPAIDIDPDPAAAQSAWETDNWRSPKWVDSGNPAGIGVTDGPDLSMEYESGQESAMAHLVHLYAYIHGKIEEGHPLHPWIPFDPRYGAVLKVPACGKCRIIDDLERKHIADPRWATDPGYAEGVAAKGTAIFGEEQPVANTYGKVPKPKAENRIIPDGVTTAYDRVDKRVIRGVVWHRMIGTLWGTDSYFRGEARHRALTDYGVGVVAQDGAANAGRILMWNDPRGTRAPWASGPVSSPYGDGLAFVNRYGVARVGPDTTAIEISGVTYGVALDEASRQSIAEITAYWADQAKIPWETFPTVPNEARSFVLWHQEFTIGTGKVCPGEVVIRETNSLIERTRGILKRYQTATTEPVVVKPTPPPTPIVSQTRNSTVFLAIEREFTALKDSPCWYRAEGDAAVITTRTIKRGDKAKVAYAAIGGDKQMWFLLDDGCRVPATVFVGPAA